MKKNEKLQSSTAQHLNILNINIVETMSTRRSPTSGTNGLPMNISPNITNECNTLALNQNPGSKTPSAIMSIKHSKNDLGSMGSNFLNKIVYFIEARSAGRARSESPNCVLFCTRSLQRSAHAVQPPAALSGHSTLQS